MLSGSGKMVGLPPMSQFLSVVKLVKEALDPFARSVCKEGVSNENGLNQQLSIFISNTSRLQNLPFIANSETMEDVTKGDSPAPDIGIFLETKDMANKPKKITVFEGKRLSKSIGKLRKREYVIGHDEKKGKHVSCGGIERFKRSIHGKDLKCAGMIGYIQDGTPDHWLNQINNWITELTHHSHTPAWKEEEKLSQVTVAGKVLEYSSVVSRQADKLHLTHLWIDLQLK